MLVTSLCWWLYDSDWFEMLVAESLCWRLFSWCWWFSQCIKSVTNILNQSPTSQTCHQHIWSPSPTSMYHTDFSLNFCLNRVFNDDSSLSIRSRLLIRKPIRKRAEIINLKIHLSSITCQREYVPCPKFLTIYIFYQS